MCVNVYIEIYGTINLIINFIGFKCPIGDVQDYNEERNIEGPK